jgi:ATP-dependent Lon protease
MRKVATKIVKGTSKARVIIDRNFVHEALGPPPHLPHMSEETKQAGVVVGLAATSYGGDILFVEATTAPGGREVTLRLTGQLGDTMRESAETAFSWVRANAKALGLSSETLSGGEIHIHVPEGAVPKDGPSAGIALASAMVSALSGKMVKGTLAMTGELSLRGKVLPVGGIKDKLLAAERSGIETVLIPRRNEKDLAEVPDYIRENLHNIPVDGVSEVLHHALQF